MLVLLLNLKNTVAAPWALVLQNLETSLNNDLSLLADQSGYTLDRNFSSFDFTGSVAATVILKSTLKENGSIIFALKDFINTASFFYKLVSKMNHSPHDVIEGKCSIFFMVEDRKPPRPGEGRLVYEVHSCTSSEVFAQGQESVLGIEQDLNLVSKAVAVGMVDLYWDASQLLKNANGPFKMWREGDARE